MNKEPKNQELLHLEEFFRLQRAFQSYKFNIFILNRVLYVSLRVLTPALAAERTQDLALVLQDEGRSASLPGQRAPARPPRAPTRALCVSEGGFMSSGRAHPTRFSSRLSTAQRRRRPRTWTPSKSTVSSTSARSRQRSPEAQRRSQVRSPALTKHPSA